MGWWEKWFAVLLHLIELEKSAEGMTGGGLNPGGGKRFNLHTGSDALLVSATLTLKVCWIGVQLSISTCLFLQWHLTSFPHKLGGDTSADKFGPLENIHPVSKGWICVVGTEDCLVLRKHLHQLRKGGMLRCRVFQWLGESQTLYKKSVQWECVRACMRPFWIYSLETLSPVPQQDMDVHFLFSQSVVYVGGISFYLGMWSLTLGRVFSKSLFYTVVCSLPL
jgi:hypothetical protein